VWGVMIFHEHLTWKMILGSAIILTGIIVGVSDVSGPAENAALPADGAAGSRKALPGRDGSEDASREVRS